MKQDEASLVGRIRQVQHETSHRHPSRHQHLHETTWDITRETQIDAPSDIVLEANKLDKALVKADILSNLLG